jgi:uncharacterized repeat protein (TIGR01451 family)
MFVCLVVSVAQLRAQATITTIVGGVNPRNGEQATGISFSRTQSVISDGAGGVYFSVGHPQHSVYRVAGDGVMTVIAGNGTSGYSGDDGSAVAAQLNFPAGIALDATGNLFIADTNNSRIRKVTPAGIITTVAGMATRGFGGDNGPAVSAQLNLPGGIALDATGNLFIADTNNHRIRMVTPAGIITTVAGTGTGTFGGDNGPAVSARLNFPSGVAVGSANTLFIADRNNYRIRKVTSDGVISTVAGIGVYGFTGDNGPAVSARLALPRGIAVDGSDNLLIADSSNSRIRKVTPAGIISTVAGNGGFGFAGDNGPAVSARLASPWGVAVDGSGNLFVADTDNQRIRKITPAGIISTVAGMGSFGFAGDNGPAVSALLNYPNGVAVDATGNLLIADTSNSRIRKVTPAGVISTFAGNGITGTGGDGGAATSAQLSTPAGVAVGPDGTVYIVDCSNRVRSVSPAGVIGTVASRPWSFCDFDYYDYYETARGGVAVDEAGNLFVADTFNHRVYKVTPAGAVSVVAGTGTFGFSGDGGAATSAQISEPWGIAVDPFGNLLIADSSNNRIRKVTPGGIISTVAGSDGTGFRGDGGPAISAALNFPTSVAVDGAGNLYIADTRNHRIRGVTANGIISTIAGIGTVGLSGDGGPPTSAQLDSPMGVALDAAGNLYIADTNNHRIRKVEFALMLPTLADISPAVVPQGSTVKITLRGSGFTSPLAIDAGSGVTVSNVTVTSVFQATAMLTIAANAATGLRNMKVTTSLGTSGSVPVSVAPPFPDLSIVSSKSPGNLEVGFPGTYTVSIRNGGVAPTTGPIMVTDNLPTGLTYVSGNGVGWSCSASGQDVACSNTDSLAPGSSTTLELTVAVNGNAASQVTHSPVVTVSGDLIPANNTVLDAATVVTPTVSFQFGQPTLVPGSQASVDLSLPAAFSHDITGTLTLVFSPNSAILADDPAIQFASGGRTVTFAIQANTLKARFGSNSVAAPIGFQTGTVAGTLSFNVVLQTGAVQTQFSSQRTVPRQTPRIDSVRTEPGSGNTFNLAINLTSTLREVTHLALSFSTYPALALSCGSVSGCTVAGNILTLDVKTLFDSWFLADTLFGGTSTLKVPLSIQGTVQGTVSVGLRNSLGSSNTKPFTLP